MKLTYPILGRMIEDEDGGCDGYEIDGEFEYEVEPTESDYEDYVVSKYGMHDVERESAITQMFSDYQEAIIESIKEEDEFYDFMKERYEDEANEAMRNEDYE